MLAYIIRRLLIAIPVLIGVTVINFIIINMAPGDPVDMMIDPNISAEDIMAKKEALGLNDPLYMQYFRWLVNLLQGNLGFSLTTYQPVSHMIGERIGPTVLLMGVALVVGLIIAIPLGILSATRQYSKLDYLATAGSFLGISIPNFFLALGLIYVFALELKWLPSGGMFTLGGDGGILDRVLHLILPVMVLGIGIAGKKIRYVRSSVLEILGQDYLRTARAKGLHEFVVVNKHALRNALIPIVTVVGLEVPILLGGAVVTEQIFSWPGIGQLTMGSIMNRDYPTLMALNLMAAIMVLAANLLTDIVYSVVDPRIKYK
ncbi:ABC transporter permease [Paenibacillus doosanensis]|uniref:Glutathione transport system permease protein GsiC n=1 Tax=Paenibacillus konkukensis TaxID=2020716 RepID=A0ABY4RUH2_9BACL|nr:MULTISPECIES: ABC transporter permease [Paenibacillus]MCS7462085.1 ABC transporter permease [Paenibacillus doosanensis]UQZ85153.1 Glutathione transport system permease protein GsiC [Paenibacillus konkukensis]